jgi:hypothetical protein
VAVNNGRAAALIVALASCRAGSPADPDAGPPLRLIDAAPRIADATTIPLAVDFTVSNCPLFETGPRCTGSAPLTLEFVPLGTASVTKYLWEFGDGVRSSDRTPTHTYAFPGTYDVSLAGGGVAGSAPRLRPGFVVVTTNPVGAPCDVDQQCELGLTCYCGSVQKCTAAFTRGLCASRCTDGSCPQMQTCADLSRAATATAEPWQQTLCLQTCVSDDDCAPGLRCRTLPSPGPTGWTHGCFAGAAAAPGSACRSAGGQLRGGACITGQCVDLGANGQCSLDCAKGPCPPGAVCAELTDGRHLCLQRCSADVACDRDPLLACEPPNPGPLGFTATAPPGATYCAPKVCTRHEDCGPAGLCHDDPNGAHCVLR